MSRKRIVKEFDETGNLIERKPRKKRLSRKLKPLTRYQFERLIYGSWQEKKGGRFRENGKFRTFVDDPWKVISDGKTAIRAKTWEELAEILEIS